MVVRPTIRILSGQWGENKQTNTQLARLALWDKHTLELADNELRNYPARLQFRKLRNNFVKIDDMPWQSRKCWIWYTMIYPHSQRSTWTNHLPRATCGQVLLNNLVSKTLRRSLLAGDVVFRLLQYLVGAKRITKSRCERSLVLRSPTIL